MMQNNIDNILKLADLFKIMICSNNQMKINIKRLVTNLSKSSIVKCKEIK